MYANKIVLAGIRVIDSCFCLWAFFFSFSFSEILTLYSFGHAVYRRRLLSNCVVANQLVVQCCNTLVTQKSDFSCIFIHWYKDQILNAFSGQAIYIKLSILNVYFLSPPPSPFHFISLKIGCNQFFIWWFWFYWAVSRLGQEDDYWPLGCASRPNHHKYKLDFYPISMLW